MKTLQRSLLFALLLLLECVYTLDANAESQKPLKAPETTASRNVAIIGAGSAGSSTAYYLKKFAELSGIALNITVFEREAYIGGRSTTVDVFGDPSLPIELGASIFVSVNHNLMDAARELKLEISNAGGDRSPDSNNMLGIWDGSGFVYLQGHSLSWWDTAKLLWRYGLAPIRTQNLMKKTVNRFLEMYKPPYFPFKLLTSVVQDLDLHKATAVTGSQFLAANGISDTFAIEIIQSSTRVNYGQNLALIHGLETMVCMATDGAVAIENGNWHIFAGMLDISRADVKLNSTVTSLEQRDDDTVALSYSSNGGSLVTQVFDDVVIAAPFQYSGIELSSSIERVPDKIPYVKLYVTLFASPHRLSSQKFNVPNPSDVPDMILTTLPRGLDLGSREDGVGPAGFWSISLLRTVPAPAEYPRQQHYVYKVFSPERLTAGFLASILDVEVPRSQENATVEALSTRDISWFHEKTWRSYPYEYPRHTFENIRLASNVWYTGGIESFISTMETSSLMGMNVAGLMTDEWHDKWQQGRPVSWIDWAAQRSHEV